MRFFGKTMTVAATLGNSKRSSGRGRALPAARTVATTTR
jgi:hypothetical protein